MRRTNSFLSVLIILLAPALLQAQTRWSCVDSLFGILPPGTHVYKTTDSLDGKPNIAYYFEAPLKADYLRFTADTTLHRRLTPSAFYQKNIELSGTQKRGPLLVVNCTFFSFATHQNLNTVIRDGRLVSYNQHAIAGRGKDTLTYRHATGSAIGISKRRNADVAWLYTDSTLTWPVAFEKVPAMVKDSSSEAHLELFLPDNRRKTLRKKGIVRQWQMETAVGGGPVLVQEGQVFVTNNEEWKFAGKAIDDRHPRTAMGYTSDGRLLVLVIEGRHPGKAEGATLVQEARLMTGIGAVEALNLDGGGSSCMLINGKQTIQPSDKEGERAVPAVFIVKVP